MLYTSTEAEKTSPPDGTTRLRGPREKTRVRAPLHDTPREITTQRKSHCPASRCVPLETGRQQQIPGTTYHSCIGHTVVVQGDESAAQYVRGTKNKISTAAVDTSLTSGHKNRFLGREEVGWSAEPAESLSSLSSATLPLHVDARPRFLLGETFVIAAGFQAMIV